MLRNFEKWLQQEVGDQRDSLKKFIAAVKKRDASVVLDDHLEDIAPHFIVDLGVNVPTEEPSNVNLRDPWTISAVLDDQNCFGVCKYKASTSPIITGIKVEYVLGTLVARLVNEKGFPVSISTHLHSQKFDSRKGINVETFDLPSEELLHLVHEVKKKLADQSRIEDEGDKQR